MQRIMALFTFLISVFLSGCLSPSEAPSAANASNVADGVVAAYEDGNLELRLDSGKTMLLRTPSYDGEISNSKGRRCRVQWKRVWSDDVAAYGWFDEITFFEWLEPFSSRFGSVWGA